MEQQKKLQRRKVRFRTQLIDYQRGEEEQSAHIDDPNRLSIQTTVSSSANSHQDPDFAHKETEDNKNQIGLKVVDKENTLKKVECVSRHNNGKYKVEGCFEEVETTENKQQVDLNTKNIEINNTDDSNTIVDSNISVEQQNFRIERRQFDFSQTLSFFRNLEQRLERSTTESKTLSTEKNDVSKKINKRQESSTEKTQSTRSEVLNLGEPVSSSDNNKSNQKNIDRYRKEVLKPSASTLVSENRMPFISTDNYRMFSYTTVSDFWQRKSTIQ